MFHNYENLVHSCRPITIVDDDQPYWGLIGGLPPFGVVPGVIVESTRYFCTLKTENMELPELSLFISMVDGQTSSPYDFAKNAYQIHSKETPLVQFVFHKSSPRGEDYKFASELCGRGLIVEAERPDSYDPVENIIWNHHKLGGYPFFTRYYNSIVEKATALLKDDYLHFIQFSFPDNYDAPVYGSWPFRDSVFHVFTKNVNGELDYRYCWG